MANGSAALPEVEAAAAWRRLPICEPGGGGLLLPLFEEEQTWPDGWRGALYGLGMVYCFLGVSIVADIFMTSIEAITSRRRQVLLRSGHVVTRKVWNDTVANLSLMALGSSAPEIFLSVIDLLRNRMHSSDLGPSTIVGSAAFNLFVIVAVCMVSIPEGESRAVSEVPVFYVTAAFSLLAYVWLVVVVQLHTPDVVEISEALLTFGFLPVLIWASYTVDAHGFGGLLFWRRCRRPGEQAADASTDATPEELPDRMSEGGSGSLECRGRKNSKSSTTTSRMSAELRRSSLTKKHQFMASVTMSRSPTVLRGSTLGDLRSFTPRDGSSGGRPVSVASNELCARVQLLADLQHFSRGLEAKPVLLVRSISSLVEFRIEYSVHVLEKPVGPPSMVHTAPEACRQWAPLAPCPAATAAAPEEAPETPAVFQGEVIFRAGDEQKEILVPRPSVAPGCCEDFAVRLGSVEVLSAASASVLVGPIACSQVVAAPAFSRGVVKFPCERLSVLGTPEKQTLEVVVLRADGCSGAVRCFYRTETLSAVPGFHFAEAEGKLDFGEGVTEARLELQVRPLSQHRTPKEFLVILSTSPEAELLEGWLPADFDPQDDGGAESAILTVRVEAPAGGSSFWRWLDSVVGLDAVRAGNSEWYDTVSGVLFVSGSLEEQRSASVSDWAFHLLSLPWKVLFVLVPATGYFGGWACFTVSLLFVALLTGVIADLAELFGCVLKIPDMVTAITFVALGTSMPDLFASKSAATEDPTADASIVNVTGSNSVNVFIGLGLPWSIGAIYWACVERTLEWEARYPHVSRRMEGTAFVVESSNLGFSVLVFAACCILALGLLMLRRQITGCELGGPAGVKFSVATAFVGLWVGYIGLASWRCLRTEAEPSEEAAVVLSVSAAELLLAAVPVAFLAQYRRSGRPGGPGAAEAVEATDTVTELGAPTEERRAGGFLKGASASVRADSFEVQEGVAVEEGAEVRKPHQQTARATL